jgi:hypothetical protein
MSKLPENSLDLWNKAVALSSVEVVIDRIYRQLRHDFKRVGIPFKIDAKSNPKEWIYQVAETLLRMDHHQLPQLLYLIDLPESLSNTLLSANDNYAQLSEAIIYRELIKVYFKIQYSGLHNEENSFDSQEIE